MQRCIASAHDEIGVVTVSRNQRTRVKLLSAVIGGSALVAMGALAVAINPQPTAGPAFVSSGGMSTGVTVTTTTPPAALETSFAVPPVKATFFGES
jgi:hypothetical protein